MHAVCPPLTPLRALPPCASRLLVHPLAQAGSVTVHLKRHPTFVSDATPADLELHLRAMSERGRSGAEHPVRGRLAAASECLLFVVGPLLRPAVCVVECRACRCCRLFSCFTCCGCGASDLFACALWPWLKAR